MEHDLKKQEILNKIKEYENIIIVRHLRPDGDCMGSSLGLREILRLSFPNKNILSIGNDKSEYLSFLGEEDQDVDDDLYKKSLIIVVDTATSDRIDNKKYLLGKEIIKIDHHIAVENYGHINYVREDLPATALIIIDFYSTFKDELKIDKHSARYLYVGLITDTGRFRYRGVNATVLRLAAEILETDIDLENIYAHLYIKDPNAFKLQGYILNNFKVTKHGVTYFIVTKRILKKFNLSKEDASALINTLDSFRGNLIWIFFIIADDSIRVRLRSRFVAIDKLANKYRGGGHKQAAGATLYRKKEIKALLKDADELLKEFKLQNEEAF